MAPERPYLRSLLYPFWDVWSGGPGLPFPIVRFGLPTSWRTGAESGDRDAPASRIALLMPEMPFAVLPHSIRQAAGIYQDQAVPARWQGRPLPLWRGVPCRLGSAWMNVLNQEGPVSSVELSVLVLLPERDPAGPRPEHVLLGAQFLTHYDLRVTLDYPALRRISDPGLNLARIDASQSCGQIELF